ncbi:putative NADPH dehydrogenase [Paramyrothecium foliicola]|nr:putative NADPH dehydrogenase [Paramyrothecium foliicola]
MTVSTPGGSPFASAASANSTLLSKANPGAPGVAYFTPKQMHNPGTPCTIDGATPTLFTPLKIRDVVLRNRLIVSPMCQFSTASTGPEIGQLTDYHLATLGHYGLKGAALVFIEATGVQPNGRISPNCPGLWEDAQIAPIKRVADFLHSQGALCAIQLAHAGRKASTVAPWIANQYRTSRGWPNGSIRATEDVGGWPEDVVGPMGGVGECWDGLGLDETGGFFPPRALTEPEIQQLIKDWGRAAARAVQAGVDVIEIHAAHGYLVHQFLSPVTNRRADKYGGDFEGRTRLAKEIVEEVRRNIPAGMPLFFRVSSTDWLEGSEVESQYGSSWDVESTVRLAEILPDWGVDLLDVSSGGNHHLQNTALFSIKDYQTSRAGRIRQAVRKAGKNLLIGAVGLITEATVAKDLVQQVQSGSDLPGENNGIEEEARVAKDMTQANGATEPMADAIFIARQFMKEPEWVLKVAWQLGVEVSWPSQFRRVKFP